MGKQALGALVGMGAATLLYVSLQELSLFNIKGILVNTSTVSENTGQVRVSSANVDDETLRRIAYRARTVAETLEASKKEVTNPTAPTALQEKAAANRTRREAIAGMRAEREKAVTYDMQQSPEQVVSEEQRLAIRAARAQGAASVPTVTKVATAKNSATPVAASVARTETVAIAGDTVSAVYAPATHRAATETPKSLPHSGLALNLLVLLSLMLALCSLHTGIRARALAMIQV